MDEQPVVWDGERWIPASEAGGRVLPGAIGPKGRMWDGLTWIDSRSDMAQAIRRAAAEGVAPPSAQARLAAATPSRRDVVDRAALRTARATEAVAFGLLAILCAGGGIAGVAVFGAAAGSLVALVGLAAAAALAVISFVKIISSDYLPPAA